MRFGGGAGASDMLVTVEMQQWPQRQTLLKAVLAIPQA